MHIALVDPSRTVLKSVSRLLEARDHQVHPFTNARDALEVIKTNEDLDAVITSAELTPISGLELCWEARLIASSRRPLYVILMSSSSDRRKLSEALDSGADDFISKPPIPEELYARLRAAERLASMQRELIRFATTDPLTGLLNRRAFFERAEEASVRAGAGSALSVIMVDIDHFKRINDLYGHDAGDNVIRTIAGHMATESELAARLGGEEFVLLLERRTLAQAIDVAERLRTKLASSPFEIRGDSVTVTCSFGVSGRNPGDTIDGMLRRADVALYAAKGEGRNRVVTDDPALCVTNYDQWNSVIRSRPA